MGKQNNNPPKNRRWFLSGGLTEPKASEVSEKVKMLTADGKLVEVDKRVIDSLKDKKIVSNKDILEWMTNPSKP